LLGIFQTSIAETILTSAKLMEEVRDQPRLCLRNSTLN
jgi:hypothetical protein